LRSGDNYHLTAALDIALLLLQGDQEYSHNISLLLIGVERQYSDGIASAILDEMAVMDA
jgi:hypothetical protein